MPYYIPPPDEVAAGIIMDPWRQRDGILRAKLSDDLAEYQNIVRQAITRAVDEIIARP